MTAIPTLTIVEHVQTPTGYRLTVHVPNTPATVFGTIAGTAVDEQAMQVVETDDGEGGTVQVPTGDALVTIEWDPDVDPAGQLTETRALIEHALTTATAPDPAPAPITPPGTEL